MHLVALNIIMWIRTLIKESIEEIIEFEVSPISINRYAQMGEWLQ